MEYVPSACKLELPTDTLVKKGFYLAFSAPILFYVVYQFKDGKPGSLPFLHNLIEKYTDVQENYAKKVALHSAAIEQAAFDRRIFQTEEKTGLSSGIELRFPEYSIPIAAIMEMR